MSDPFTSLQISPAGTVTIPTYTPVFRVPFGAPIPHTVGDDTLRSLHILNFTLLPDTGTTDSLVQILGGSPGQWIALSPENVGDEIRLVHSVNLVMMPFQSDVVLTDPSHVILLVRRGVDQYVKPV